MKSLFAAAALLGLSATAALAGDPNSIIYNRMGKEVGVIQRQMDDHTFIVLPTRATLDLGFYDVMMPADALRSRPQGGWVTPLSNEQIAFLPPTDHRYFQPSGD